jgi:hypothetical protein
MQLLLLSLSVYGTPNQLRVCVCLSELLISVLEFILWYYRYQWWSTDSSQLCCRKGTYITFLQEGNVRLSTYRFVLSWYEK